MHIVDNYRGYDIHEVRFGSYVYFPYPHDYPSNPNPAYRATCCEGYVLLNSEEVELTVSGRAGTVYVHASHKAPLALPVQSIEDVVEVKDAELLAAD